MKTKTSICLAAILLLLYPPSTVAKNPIIPDKGVNDPHIRIFDGKAWLSATHDKSIENEKFIMEDWWLWSSEDLVNWKLEYVLKPEDTYISKPFQICFYAMADNPYGPYDYKGTILEEESFAPGYIEPTWPHGFKQGRHGSFFEWHNQWYFSYCDISQTGNRYFRDAFISYVHYKENGEMALIRVDGIGVGEYDADAGPIEAEDYFRAEGITKKEDAKDGFRIAGIDGGDYLVYNNIEGLDHKTRIRFKATVGRKTKLEVRENGPDGRRLAKCTFKTKSPEDSGGYEFVLPPMEGTTNLCFACRGKKRHHLEIDSFTFQE